MAGELDLSNFYKKAIPIQQEALAQAEAGTSIQQQPEQTDTNGELDLSAFMQKRQEKIKNIENKKVGYIDGLIGALGQGASFGVSDEVSASMQALADSLKGESSFKDSYDKNVTQNREKLESFSDEYPITSNVAEFAGGLGTGVAGLGRAAAKLGMKAAARFGAKEVPNAVKYVAGGAVGGATSGAGNANPDTDLSMTDSIQERASGALGGAALGGAIGGAAPVLGSAIAGTARAIGKGAGAVGEAIGDTFREPTSKAARDIKRQFQRDQISTEQAIQNKIDLGDDAALMDLGDSNVLGAAKSIAIQPGEGANKIKNFYGDRSKSQGNRLEDAVFKNISKKADEDPETAVKRLKEYRSGKAKPLYEEAFQGKIKTTDDFAQFKNYPIVEKAMKNAKATALSDPDLPKSVRQKIQELDTKSKIIIPGKAANDTGEELLVLWDYARREIADEIKDAPPSRQRLLINLNNKIKESISKQNPSYNKALKQYETDSKLINAYEDGLEIFKDSSKNTKELVRRFNKMTAPEKEEFRAAAGNEILKKIRNTKESLEGVPSASLLKEIYGSPSKREALQAIFPKGKNGQSPFLEFDKTAKAELKFRSNANKISGGSDTAYNQSLKEDQFSETPAADLQQALRLNVGAILRTTKRVFSNPETQEKINNEKTKILLEKDLGKIKEILGQFDKKSARGVPKWVSKIAGMKEPELAQWMNNKSNRLMMNQWVTRESKGVATGATATSIVITPSEEERRRSKGLN